MDTLDADPLDYGLVGLLTATALVHDNQEVSEVSGFWPVQADGADFGVPTRCPVGVASSDADINPFTAFRAGLFQIAGPTLPATSSLLYFPEQVHVDVHVLQQKLENVRRFLLHCVSSLW